MPKPGDEVYLTQAELDALIREERQFEYIKNLEVINAQLREILAHLKAHEKTSGF
mgnify:CR=1 FL=1